MGHIELRDELLTRQASRLAERLGTSEEEAIAKALDALEESLNKAAASKRTAQSMTDWILERRKRFPLKPTGLVADKAFYDSLNDEDED